MKCKIVESRTCLDHPVRSLVLFYYNRKDLMVTSYIWQMSLFIILTVQRFSESQHKFVIEACVQNQYGSLLVVW